MDNYICIRGKKTELTAAQVRELGFAGEIELQDFLKILRAGDIRKHYGIHNHVTVGGMEYEIIGIDHDKDTVDPTKPTVTLMGKILTDYHRWHSGACERGWIDSEIREWLNKEVTSGLPSELFDAIIPVKKITHNYKGESHETTDRLFLPGESEMFGSAIYSNYEDGPRYPAFATSELRVRTDEDGEQDWYWTRSQYGGNLTFVAIVGSGGNAGTSSAAYTHLRAPVCFTIA